MANFDDFKLAVEGATGGKNTVFFDDMGLPSVYVLIPRMYSNNLIDGAPSHAHYAFQRNSKEYAQVGFAKFQDIVMNERAYSLPGQDPRAYVTFDQALTYCRNKGDGFALCPNALWAAVALWCIKNGSIPHGNTNYGADIDHAYETGTVSYTYTSNDKKYNGRVVSGSGPASWYHDGTFAGIADLVGNVWERVSGVRVVDGEIQIIPDANSAMATCDMGENSAEWKAILQDGTLVTPGTALTLKYSGDGTIVTGTPTTTKSDTQEWKEWNFGVIKAADGVTIPYILKELMLAPIAEGDNSDGDHFWLNTDGERVPFRGGNWANGRGAGVRALDASRLRSNSWYDLGLRSAYYGDDLVSE